MNVLAWLLLISLLFFVFIRYLLKPLFKWGVTLLAKKASASLHDQTDAYNRNYGDTRYSAQEKVKIKDDLEVIIPQEGAPKKKEDPRYVNVEDVEFED